MARLGLAAAPECFGRAGNGRSKVVSSALFLAGNNAEGVGEAGSIHVMRAKAGNRPAPPPGRAGNVECWVPPMGEEIGARAVDPPPPTPLELAVLHACAGGVGLPPLRRRAIKTQLLLTDT